MKTIHTTTRRVGLCAAGALAVAVSLAGCTTVTPGVAVVGDRGPCTHVDAPMLEIPADSATEPQMRIPQPAGWEHSAELQNMFDGVRFAVAAADDPGRNAVGVFVDAVPESDPHAIFDDYRASLV